MSHSVAECLRAVFAAFVWHEGIVHDAMACASFLKFHPVLTKEPRTITDRLHTMDGNPSADPDDQAEVFCDVLKHNIRRASEVQNANELPPKCISALKERHHSDSRPRSRTVTSLGLSFAHDENVASKGAFHNFKTYFMI